MTITIPPGNLITLAIMAGFLMLSYAVQKCERYRGLVDWLRREFGDED